MADIAQTVIHVFLFSALYFEVLLLITFFEQRSPMRREKERKATHLPAVSIIVPCYNEERTLAKTVFSLLALEYPKEKLSIFLVNDGSTDGTLAIASRFAKNPQVTVLSKENGGKHTAFNYGLTHVTTEMVGCLDADSFVSPNALKEIIKYFDDPGVHAVTPAIKIADPKSLLELIQKAEYMLSIFIRKMFGALGALFVTPGPFSIFRKSVLDHVGGFKEAHNTEDLEMALRLQSQHYRIENAHTAHVYTVAPKTLPALVRQRVRWTYGFLKNAIDYRHLFLRKEYGTLGLVVLPIATISIFGALTFAGYFVYETASLIAAQVVKFQAVGVSFPNSIAVDWFFINTHSMNFLVYTLVFLTIALAILGKRMSGETKIWSSDLLAYLLLYGLIAPIWLGRAVFNTALSRKELWK